MKLISLSITCCLLILILITESNASSNTQSTTPDLTPTITVESIRTNNNSRTQFYNVLSGLETMLKEKGSKLASDMENNVQDVEEMNQESKSFDQRIKQLEDLQTCVGQVLPGTTRLQRQTQNVNVQNSDLNSQIESVRRQQAALDTREATLRAQIQQYYRDLQQLNQAETDLQRVLGQDRLKHTQEQQELNRLRQNLTATRQSRVNVTVIPRPVPVQRIAESECHMIFDCESCAAHAGCGWCGVSGLCLPSFNGTTSQCDADSWSWRFCKTSRCEQHKKCSTCIADPRCGYCPESKKCLSGDVYAPTSGTCSSNWTYSDSLKFLSFNIYGRDAHNVSSRADWLMKVMKAADADIIALQEVEDWFTEKLYGDKWAQQYYATEFGNAHAAGNLYILSRFPMQFSYVESVRPAQIEVDQRARAMIASVQIANKSTSTLTIANTVLDWQSWTNRVDAIDFITDALINYDDVILAGDFNFDSDSSLERARFPREYVDIWPMAHPEWRGATWNPLQNQYARDADPTSIPMRLDRIFVKSGSWSVSSVDKVGCPEASPHYGLLATLSFQAPLCV